MATESHVYDESYLSKSDNSAAAKQFLAVEFTAENEVDPANAAGDLVVGILQNKPKAAEAAQIRHLGRSKAVVDGTAAIAVGDNLGTDAAGKLVKKTANNDWVIARALQASTAAGDIIDVLLTGGFYLGA